MQWQGNFALGGISLEVDAEKYPHGRSRACTIRKAMPANCGNLPPRWHARRLGEKINIGFVHHTGRRLGGWHL